MSDDTVDWRTARKEDRRKRDYWREFGFSGIVVGAMVTHEIADINALTLWTARDLRRLYNVGVAAIENITLVLADHGLKLADAPVPKRVELGPAPIRIVIEVIVRVEQRP